MFRSLLKIFFALILLCGGAGANDTSFGGEGSALMPISNDQITMADEHIVLDGVPATDFPALQEWHVTCTFHFKNESKAVQKVTMGFPFPRTIDLQSEARPENLENLDPELQKEMSEPEIRDFTAKVRGLPVAPREIAIKSKASRYGRAYVWDVEFAPGEAIEVVNTYKHYTSYSAELFQFVTYVLRTGKNWKGGKIGRSLIEVRPHLHFKEVDRGMSAYGLNRPKGYRYEADGIFVKVVWDLKAFSPDSDLYYAFVPTTEPWDEDLKALEARILRNPDASCKDLRIMRNAYYATKNYPFKSADLTQFFKQYSWYEPNPQFNPKKLSVVESGDLFSHVNAVKAIEKQKGCK